MPANHCAKQFVVPEPSRRVIIPIERSHCTYETIEWYLANAMQPKDQLIFLHVLSPKTSNSLLGLRIPTAPHLVGTQMEISKKSLMEARHLCQAYVQRAVDRGLVANGFVYVDAQPGPGLVRAIQRHRGDLVLLWNEEARDSASGKYVLKHASVPVTVIPSSS